MMKRRLFIALLLLLAFVFGIDAQKSDSKGRYSVHITLVEKGSNEAIVMGNCLLQPLGAYATTNADGKATIANVPAGSYTLQTTYVGFEELKTQVLVTKDLDLRLQLTPTSLALKEVVVTAKQNVAGASTASIIGRQAIDHLQATSLADVMQLVPGQLMGNADLTVRTPLQLRSLSYNSTSAFGSSIIVDGVPISNNGEVTQGGYSSTAAVGTDLRQVSADNIEQVEVIRGIPSAEYGDLTSGLVVVHSKTGVTPWMVRAKMNPELQNYSLGKGFALGRAGIVNLNADYAKAWGDPRMKTRSYNRYTFGVGYGLDITRKWHTETKLRYMRMRDWSGNDPDAVDDGTSNDSRNFTLGLTHNGRLSLNRLLVRTLSYTVGLSLNRLDTRNTTYRGNASGLIPLITARETGYFSVPWKTSSYLATGITESRPGSFYAKVGDAFYLKAGPTRQSFKLGTEYHCDWNSGRGYYNADEGLPYAPNSNGRPRAFSDIPALHQLSLYGEDQFNWNLDRVHRLRVQLGLRFTSQQPFSAIATTSLSPRLNISFSLTPWLDLRGGFGLNAKTPSLAYLYPDKKYDDRVSANYMPPSDPAAQLLVYHTQVYDVKRSTEMKNATTTKVELGLDFRLPHQRQISLLAYQDRTPNGFGPVTEYTAYRYNYYTPGHGLILSPGAATMLDPAHPAQTFTVMTTTGKVGNTLSSLNRGVEFSLDLGRISALNTTLELSGAYTESKSWSTDLNSASPRPALLPSSYTIYGFSPFKVIYPSGKDFSRYRRFLNTLRIVTAIPALRLVASFSAQVIWHNYSYSFTADREPIGWITPDLVRHEITPSMAGGYIALDGTYHDTKPASGDAIRISDLSVKTSDNQPATSPITWNLMGRLTKELGKLGGLSLFVNNLMFYEPFLRSDQTATLSQRNTGTFGYGIELYLKL
jgi:hypothetical protein